MGNISSINNAAQKRSQLEHKAVLDANTEHFLEKTGNYEITSVMFTIVNYLEETDKNIGCLQLSITTEGIDSDDPTKAWSVVHIRDRTGDLNFSEEMPKATVEGIRHGEVFDFITVRCSWLNSDIPDLSITDTANSPQQLIKYHKRNEEREVFVIPPSMAIIFIMQATLLNCGYVFAAIDTTHPEVYRVELHNENLNTLVEITYDYPSLIKAWGAFLDRNKPPVE